MYNKFFPCSNSGVEVSNQPSHQIDLHPYAKHKLKARRAVKILVNDFGLTPSDMHEFYDFYEGLPQSVTVKLSASQLAETFYGLKAPAPLQ